MKILSRKPRPTYAEGAEVALIQRDDANHPYVVATITPHSLQYGEWCHGHYFKDISNAVVFFSNYPENRQ